MLQALSVKSNLTYLLQALSVKSNLTYRALEDLKFTS